MRIRCAASILFLVLFAGFFAFLAAFVPLILGFFVSLVIIYAVGAVGLIARFYWARWFARGLGWWGVMSGSLLMYAGGGISHELLIFTIVHGLIIVLLGSAAVAQLYDGQERWRKNLDEKMQRRVAGLFTNLGTALPYIAFYAFIPRGSGFGEIAAFAILGAALYGLVRGKSWGLLAVGVSSLALLGTAVASASCSGILLAVLVAAGFAPFVPTIVGFLREKPAE